MLDTLMNVFWHHGYAGTSLSTLTEATGLTKPSLYAAYGNKEAMFCAALGCYLQLQSETVYVKLQNDERDLPEALTDFLKATAAGATQSNRPAGCFIVGASCDAEADLLPADAQTLISQINTMGTDMLVSFFRSHLGDKTKGGIEAEALAEYVLVLQTGLVQMAVRRMNYAALERAIEIAMTGLNNQLSDR